MAGLDLTDRDYCKYTFGFLNLQYIIKKSVELPIALHHKLHKVTIYCTRELLAINDACALLHYITLWNTQNLLTVSKVKCK